MPATRWPSEFLTWLVCNFQGLNDAHHMATHGKHEGGVVVNKPGQTAKNPIKRVTAGKRADRGKSGLV